jgi:hypothetical protein
MHSVREGLLRSRPPYKNRGHARKACPGLQDLLRVFSASYLLLFLPTGHHAFLARPDSEHRCSRGTPYPSTGCKAGYKPSKYRRKPGSRCKRCVSTLVERIHSVGVGMRRAVSRFGGLWKLTVSFHLPSSFVWLLMDGAYFKEMAGEPVLRTPSAPRL